MILRQPHRGAGRAVPMPGSGSRLVAGSPVHRGCGRNFVEAFVRRRQRGAQTRAKDVQQP